MRQGTEFLVRDREKFEIEKFEIEKGHSDIACPGLLNIHKNCQKLHGNIKIIIIIIGSRDR